MLRKILLIIFVSTSPLISQNIRIVDFSAEAQTFDANQEQDWSLGLQAFNFSPELIPFFALLQREYNLPMAIETGTFEGRTTTALSRLFKKVHTIEIVPSKYESVSKKLLPFSNVECHLGSSDHVLLDILPHYVEKKVLFYLDAHGDVPWPLLGELHSISKTHRDNCIVVIDDFKVPGRPDISYDVYGQDECSFQYVQAGLAKIFSDYECCIVIPKQTMWRAKFVAFPRSWGTQGLKAAGYYR